MANYESAFVTNEFKIKEDKIKLTEILCSLVRSEHFEVDIDKNKRTCSFAGYGYYELFPSDEDGYEWIEEALKDNNTPEEIDEIKKDIVEYGEEETILKLWQSVLEDDSYIIFMESGHEKLRYVGGFTMVITPHGVKSSELNNLAKGMVDEINSKARSYEFSIKEFVNNIRDIWNSESNTELVERLKSMVVNGKIELNTPNYGLVIQLNDRK